ncbi:MAG: hypothetical protein QOK24_2527 [Verrucomicrobiota bacterium]|jgi:hypothetical protein
MISRCSRVLLACSLGLFLLFGGADRALSYSLNGYKWPSGSQIGMHLGLNGPPVLFQDGSASWNASAADALATWNQYVDAVKFVEAPAISPSGDDGANSVFFSSTIYGQAFGASTLAVTINYSNLGSGVFTETDVIFNNARTWNSYRGPIQGSGAGATYDFHRVALHEFGHVLGLDHPDQHGQNVVALMNSIITDLDHLADDDIAGARSLYQFKLTSSLNPPAGRSGDNFAYQVTANNNPSNYTVTGLPAGLQLDTGTGLISGRCSTSGTFQVDITVQGTLGMATGRVQIVITPLPITSLTFIQIQVGESMSYQISAGNNPTSYGAAGLPAGLQTNSATGLVSGIPQNTGTFDARITANSAVSEAAAILRIVVMAPRITSSTLPSPVEFGDPFTYQITATNAPTSFGVVNLPAGLQFNPATGLINGTSTIAGVFNVTVTAQTAFGTASALVQIVIGAPRITSSSFVPPVDIGSNFTYQITGSNHPYAFTATGLPAGLSLDPVSGEISGVAELSGQYQVQITATGTTGTASATLVINIRFLDSPDTPLKKLPLTIYGTIVADPARPRLYAVTSGGLAVVDTESLAVIQTIPIPSSLNLSGDLSISADGNKLWVTGYLDRKINGIDLNTLTLSTTFTTTLYPTLIREGADGRLYVSDRNQSDIFQLDASTGATISRVTPPGNFGYSTIEISPDRKTLYVAGQSPTSPIARYSLSPGNPPALIQQIQTTNGVSQGRKLAVSPNGGSVSLVTWNASFGTVIADPTLIRSTTDLNVIQKSFVSPSPPNQLVYNPDGSLAFQAMLARSRIDVFQTGSAQLVRTITLPDQAKASEDIYTGSSMAVDRTNSYLFVAALSGPASGLYVYSLVPPASPPTPPKSLLNISTRLKSQGGDDVLIGGFIITGQEAKTVVLRAMGPSLPLPGKLADPALELRDATGALVGKNDNWNARRADVLATGFAPLDEHEAVIAATLHPGSYTAVVRGVNSTSGVALVELYDLTANSNSKLANISTRGKVENGDNVMIGGFILGGDQPTIVAVRAIGPSLANYGIAHATLDPILQVHDGNGVLFAQDDDWRTYQEQALIDSGLAPTDNRESAMLLSLQPGAYTAIVRGKDDSVGVGLVEVYNLDAK